ncbi:berberine bridge enzyme-like 17 [Pyrus communis]|uniref:berberine bridge enzyme-like 17 n=1 Tax=Pyrus communis TaxID=23211 RepID=UPI0035BF727C
MKFPSSPFQLAILSILSVVTVSWATSDPLVNIDDFLQCLSKQSQSTSSVHAAIYTPQNTSFQSVLSDRIKNRRFSTSTTPKPLAIVAAKHDFNVQATVLCAKQQGLQIRIRSGGHDYEGLSYVSHVPFIILDMFQLQSVNVNVGEETAWVQSGATLGQIYYKIAEKSNFLGFPAGVGPTVGAGGHFGGGGYGPLMRKYGLSIDNIIDAKIVVADGRVLDRKSMGEDLFWAIRGGGGASFGVILSWKLKLVSVPAKVTVFNVSITLEKGATDVVYKWQYVAPQLPKDLFIRVRPLQVNSTGGKKTVKVSFIGLFLGRTNKLLPLVKERLPELGLQRRDCFEMSWIENKVFFADYPFGTPITVLLNRTNGQPSFFKARSDYVKKPIPKRVIESLWKEMIKIDNFWMDWNPYGGRMGEISESATPSPHRAGNLFLIQYYAVWVEEGVKAASKYLQLSRKFFDLMTPYVSKNPREAFQNYRDLEIGANLDNQTNFQIAKIYGSEYFKGNFDRLVRVKTMVDPHNFFKHEQSIPPI